MILGTRLGDQEIQISSWDEVVVIHIHKIVLNLIEKNKGRLESAVF